MRQTALTRSARPAAANDTAPIRRRAPRSRALLFMARLHAGPVDERCMVLDISPCGAAVRTEAPHRVDESVRLDLGDGFAAAGTVRWSRDGQFGIEFAEPVDIAPLFAAPEAPVSPWPTPTAKHTGGRRADARIPWSTRVALQLGEERRLGELHDVSATGGRINLATTKGLARGDRVTLRIDDRFDSAGTVRWVTPGAIGLAFEHPLPLWRLEARLSGPEPVAGAPGLNRH